MEIADWQALWPQAQALWSPYLKMYEPIWLEEPEAIAAADFDGQIASINVVNQRVSVNLRAIRDSQLEAYALEILAHEIGHHVYVPANMQQNLQLLGIMHTHLGSAQAHTAEIANFYFDLLINHYLQQHSNCRFDKLYRQLYENIEQQPPFTQLYMATYENLWQLPAGTLTKGELSEQQQQDALLASRIITTYHNDWPTGASRFALLALPYFKKKTKDPQLQLFIDTTQMAQGYKGRGIVKLPTIEALHPCQDSCLTLQEEEPPQSPAKSSDIEVITPFTYQAIMRLAGQGLSMDKAVIRYYRALVQEHLLPFPTTIQPAAEANQHSGYQLWEIGDPASELDWTSSAFYGRPVIAGVTTRKKYYEASQHDDSLDLLPYDLDLYVDSSGSMPDPSYELSYPTLAGTLLCLSALRAGARVQVTLWSSSDQCISTPGFIQDEEQILAVLTGYFGGGTSFPLHALDATYAQKRTRATQIVVLSDDGVDSLYEDDDEYDTPGQRICANALKNCQGAGHLVLEISESIASLIKHSQTFALANQQGWNMYQVNSLESMLDFARSFAQQYYSTRY